MGSMKPPAAMPVFDELVARNPFEALLAEQKLREFQQLPGDKQRLFYGRVVESVFSDPKYMEVVSKSASREFDRLKGGSSVDNGDLRSVVEDVVSQILAKR